MFEKKRGKRFLASVMALVMLLSLAPVGALAAETAETTETTNTFEATAYTQGIEGSSPNGKTKAYAMWKDTDNNYYLAIASVEGNNKVDEAFQEKFPNAQYIENDQGLTVKLDGEAQIDNLPPKQAADNGNGGPEGVWIILVMTPTELKGLGYQNGTFNLGINAGGFNIDTITINDDAFKGTVDEDVDPSEPSEPSPQYVIRFYVSNTGTKGYYTEDNKYGIAGQPNSTIVGAEGGDTVTIMVSPDYAILTQYTDVAKGISTEDFKDVKVTGDTDVRAWLNQYAQGKVPDGLMNRDNVNVIVGFVNTQYNNSGKNLPTLNANDFNGFRFVDAHYVNSGECSIHVHVQLIKDNQYTVQYAPNGGDGAMVDENLYFTGNQATVKANEFTRTGYTFDGWNTQADGMGDDYSSGDSITIAGEEVTLYAQWTPQTYRINYELYSGTNANINPTGYTYGEGVSSFAPATKDNYNFEGWYSDPEFRNKVESISTTDTGDKTLYAHWNEDPAARPTTTDVYVYFKMVDAAGNNISRNKINNEDLKKTVYNKEAGGATWATLGKIALTGDITEDTLTNAGKEAQVQLKNDNNLWSTNKDIAQTVLANVQWFQLKQWAGATDYVPDGSRWHLDGKITGYTVTYNNGTTEATDDVDNMPGADEMYYLSGSEYTVSDATPTRTGYVFTGWKSNIENDTTIYNAKGKFEMPAKNVVLTAQWEKDELVDPSVDKPAGITKGDGIADKYQIQVNFKAVNGTFKDGKNSITEYTTVVTKYTSGEPSENGTAKLANEHLKAENPDPGFTGPGSWKKGTDACEKPKADDSVQNGDHFVVTFEQKKESVANPIHYTINQHFMDGEGKPSTANPDITTNKTTTNAQAELDSLITGDLKQSKTGTDGKTYVYVPGETKFTVNGEAVTALVEGTEIHLYYYLDEVGGTSEKEGADTPDNIPDAWQYKVTFKVVNGNWNVSKKNEDVVVYVNAKDKNGNVLDSKLTANQIPAVGSEPNSGYKASGSWNKTPSDGLVINADTTFTFTYSKRSSSGGSSRPSTPTVTIPDNVPTGLNGTDHYAYIIGYGNNDVRPQNNITRAEVATIFFRLLTDETRTANMTKSNSYNDVKDGDWFCCAVSTLSKMGIIKGYEDGSFKPNDPISRAEFAAIAARFDPDGDKTPATFADVTSHWAKDEISIAANHGWIKGYEDGSFKPDQKITRAETMTLVNRVLNRLPEAKDDLHKDMKTWVDNMDETAWYYLAVQEATNSHYFKNKTGTKFEQWTDLRDTRDWSELEK